MDIEVVIGANYGDEGKGLVTDYICSRNPNSIVVLNNGGSQRGHTVERKDGSRHVFHHFGSGTLQGVPTYFSKNFYLNPMEFIREYNELSQAVKDRSRLRAYYDPDCIIQLPSDIAVNWHLERSRNMLGIGHGSVGCGIWETHIRHKRWHDAITLTDFCKMSYMQKMNYINYIAKRQRRSRCRDEHMSNDSIELFDLFMSQGFVNHYISDCMEMHRLCEARTPEFVSGWQTVVIENGQGLLLDESYSYDPIHSTPSMTGANGAADFVNRLKPPHNVKLNYVSRTYITRHGPGGIEGAHGSWFPYVDKTNQSNEWQGSLKYGKLDPDTLARRTAADADAFKAKVDNTCAVETNMFFTHCNEEPAPETPGVYSSSTPFADDIIKLN